MREKGGPGREAALGRFLCDDWTALGARQLEWHNLPEGDPHRGIPFIRRACACALSRTRCCVAHHVQPQLAVES